MSELEDQIDAWFSRTSVPGPELVISHRSLEEDVATLTRPGTMIVVDPYNHGRFADRYPMIAVVDDSNESTLDALGQDFTFDSIIAIGGCTALDVGRACAKAKPVTCIPTILSSSCISSSTSVIRRVTGYSCEQATEPQRTILNLPTLTANHRDPRKNWSASGLGDLLSTLGAIAERNIDNKAGIAVFEQDAPLCIAALDWIEGLVYPLEDAALLTLGKLLHIFSISGHATAPVGSEHEFYYKLRERHSLPRMIATHGKIVGAASLLALRVWSENRGDTVLLEKTVRVFEKVGLPSSFSALQDLGVTRASLRDAINSTRSVFYTEQCSQNGLDWFYHFD